MKEAAKRAERASHRCRVIATLAAAQRHVDSSVALLEDIELLGKEAHNEAWSAAQAAEELWPLIEQNHEKLFGSD